MKYDICHADTCLPDYWSGHHKAHIQIPVYHGMTLKAIKDALRDEIRNGAILGGDRVAYLLGSDLVQPHEEKEADKAISKAYAAINRIKPFIKGQRRFFTDLEPETNNDETCESVYAYFVIMEID